MSRHLSRHQAILNFKFPDDVMAGFDQVEREVRQYRAITGKHIDEDTMSGVILGASTKSSNEKHRDFANHLVLNAYRLDFYDKMFVGHPREQAARSTSSPFPLTEGDLVD